MLLAYFLAKIMSDRNIQALMSGKFTNMWVTVEKCLQCYSLPFHYTILKALLLVPPLSSLHFRICPIFQVTHFVYFRNLLLSDLCSHYEYNEFLMSQLMELMPYGELIDLLG